MVELRLAKGANRNLEDREGKTAFDSAFINGRIKNCGPAGSRSGQVAGLVPRRSDSGLGEGACDPLHQSGNASVAFRLQPGETIPAEISYSPPRLMRW